jgi:predicted Fe-Mo cluster-binding NifX family protein
MRVAIPVFNGRVAPVFDWAGRLLLVELGGQAPPKQEARDLCGVAPVKRAEYLRSAGAEVLICGGISSVLATLVASEGIELIPGIVGDAQEVLAAYASGRLRGPRWAMPGWCGGGGRRSGRARRGGFCGGRGGRRRGRSWGPGPGGGMT